MRSNPSYFRNARHRFVHKRSKPYKFGKFVFLQQYKENKRYRRWILTKRKRCFRENDKLTSRGFLARHHQNPSRSRRSTLSVPNPRQNFDEIVKRDWSPFRHSNKSSRITKKKLSLLTATNSHQKYRDI